MEMERPPSSAHDAADWVASFLRSIACPEEDVGKAKDCIVHERIDGEVLVDMSTDAIVKVLHLKYGDAQKLEKALKLCKELSSTASWQLMRPPSDAAEAAQAPLPEEQVPPEVPVQLELPVPLAVAAPLLVPGKRGWCPSPMSQKMIWMVSTLIFLTCGMGVAVWWENHWQKDLCGELLACGMNETGEVAEIFRTSQKFERLLKPPRLVDSNWLRAKLSFGSFGGGTSCFESISQHVSNCLQKAKGAADSCEDEACVFAISDAVKHLDAAIGGQMLGHKITDIEDLKQEIIDSLSRRGKQLHEKLAHEISLEQIPDLASFFDTWGRLHTFIGKAQNASLSAPLERPVQMMKLVSANATAKMNLTAPINRLLGWTKSLENSGELTGSDLEYVSSLLNQALQRYKDGSDLSAAYRTWTTDLCTSLQEFASELKSSELPATFMYMAIVDHFKQHLEGCPWEDTFAECKNTFAASLRSKKGLQDVRKALDKQRSWLNWITGSDGSILVRSVETYLKSGLSSLRQELERSDLDLVVAFENFEPLRMAATELEHHLQKIWPEQVTSMSEDLWRRSFAALKDVDSDIQSGCSSASMPSHLRWVAELERYVWHRSDEHQKAAELGTQIANLGKQLKNATVHSEALIRRHNSTTPVNVKQLRGDLEEARRCIRGAVPWFVVFAEDADLCGNSCSGPFEQIHHEIAEKLGPASKSFPFLRKLTRIGLSAKQACDCSAIRAIESENRTENARSLFHSSAVFAKQSQEVVVRKKASLQYLLSECSRPSECNATEMHMGFVFSDIVHDIFGEQLGKLRFALDRDLDDDALAIFTGVSDWAALHQVVQPELKVTELERGMKDAIVGRAKGLASQASEHYIKRWYKSLQSNLAAMKTLQAKFSAVPELDQLQHVWDMLRKKILGYVKEVRNDAMTKVNEGKDGKGELEGFANNLITLGLIAFEIPTFKDDVLEQINEVLNEAHGESMGVQYMLNLGQFLMQHSDAGGSLDDGTMSRSAAAKRIASEFKQFQNVQNMFWNQAVQKMQKAPEQCVEEMSAKQVLDNQNATLDRDDLKEGLSRFWDHYDALLNRSLDGEICSGDIVNMCLREVASLRNRHNASGEVLEPLLIKESIPQLLAHVFAYYSITTTGDEFMSFVATSKEQSKHRDIKPLLGGIKTPHNMQVLAILRFFGFGDENKQVLANQLVQVETGGGKSLILGAAATMVAMLGFDARVACYSDFLSSKDAKDFFPTFSDFKVAPEIKYSKITTFSEDMVAAKGDIRSLTLDLFAGKPLKTRATASEADVSKKQVLLVDEVDVFMGPEFVGKTHDLVARLQHPSARKVLESLWQRRQEVQTPQGARKLCIDVKTGENYLNLVNSFKAFQRVIESQVRMMCTDLHDYMQKTHPMPEFNPVQGCIGYKIQDRIDCDAVSGYKTAYAHLEDHKKLNKTEARLNEALSVLVPSGQFSYTNISPRYIFGVSGTVEQLQPFQRQEVKKHGLHVFTTMPSVYGHSKFRFLEQGDAIKIVKWADFFQEIALAIQEKINQRRAIIVFFENERLLQEFRRSSFFAKLASPEVLAEGLSFDEKAHIIKKAANTGQITLATAAFGRGSDFVSYDDKLQEHGGVHVLQTFPSADASEEVQFQGRTARQGKKGTYSLILREEDVQQKLGLAADILHDGQSKGYEKIVSARDKKAAEKFANLASDLKETHEKDVLSHALLDALVAGNQKKATDAYLDFYERWMQGNIASSARSAAHHYVICLDESGSMYGQKFEAAKTAVQNFAREAAEKNQGTASAVSLIMFSFPSRGVVCDQTPLDQHTQCTGSITFGGGGTEFDTPLRDAMGLVQGNKDRYDKQFILFYTDGLASYPDAGANQMKSFRDSGGKLEFFAIAESQAESLNQICKKLYPSSPVSDHCLSHVKPEEISGAMQETLRRMNMAFVQA